MDNLERKNQVYYTFKDGWKPLLEDCDHDFEPFRQEQSWGVVEWEVCLKCGGRIEKSLFGSYIDNLVAQGKPSRSDWMGKDYSHEDRNG